MSQYTSTPMNQHAPLGARLVREDVGPGEYPRADEPAPNDNVPHDETPNDGVPTALPTEPVAGGAPRQPGNGRHRRELHPRHVRGTVRVSLGRVLATPGALHALADARANPADYLARHAAGDWGELDAEDSAANDRALAAGERLLSAYRLPTGEPLWVITEADRSSSCVLTPAEY